jgi:hypothetical protein
VQIESPSPYAYGTSVKTPPLSVPRLTEYYYNGDSIRERKNQTERVHLRLHGHISVHDQQTLIMLREKS